MILPRYTPAIAFVDRDRAVSRLVRRDLRLCPRRPIIYALSERGLGQADLVLSLLRIDTRGSRALIERILGSPIRVLPSMYLRWTTSGLKTTTSAKIIRIGPNPARPGSDRARRFDYCFRAGLTIEAARARGATRRDIRRALRKGVLVVGEGRAA